MNTQEIPYGYCHCGCGQKTKICPRNRPDAGQVKGEPYRYIKFHYGRAVDDLLPPNPSELCRCGCGLPTLISPSTNTRLGYVEGQPRRFLKGHNTRTKPPLGRPIEERFWGKVDKRGPDECWEWAGAINRAGYGKLLVDRRIIGAHIASYEIHNGPIPDGLWVLHRCDNRRCINPAHLFLGTAKDNTADMMAKGRQGDTALPGERNGNAHLTNEQAREFREQFSKTNMSIIKFSSLHNVSYGVMQNVLNYRSYRDA